MGYGTGEILKHLWDEMDRPPRVGTCTKLRQGQLLMQRYKYAWDTRRSHELYSHLAQKCKDRSVILAKRMVDHVEDCDTCQRERVLEDKFFYGVW